MSGSEAYHFGGIGIHWSMTEAASVAPFCLDPDLMRGSSGKLTYAMFPERRMLLVLAKMAWLMS